MLISRAAARVLAGMWCAALVGLLLAVWTAQTGLAGAPSAESLPPRVLFRLAMNSLYVSLLAAVGGLVLALVPALAAARLVGGRARVAMSLFSIAPLLLSPAVLAVVAVHLWGDQGYLTLALRALGIIHETARLGPIFTLTGTGLTMAVAYAPVPFIAAFAALRRSDADTEDAARLEAHPLQLVCHILLPFALPAIVLGACGTFLLALTDFSIPESLRSQPVLVRELYAQFGVYYDARGALRVAAVLLVLAGVCFAVFQRFARGVAGASGEWQPSRVASWRREPAGRVLRVVAWVLAVVPVLAVVATLVATLRGPSGLSSAVRQSWTQVREEIVLTLTLSLVAAILIGVLGVMLGAVLASLRRPQAFRIVLLACFVLPGPVWGIALKLALLQDPEALPAWLANALVAFDASNGPLLLAWCLRFAPLGGLLAEFHLRRVPAEQREAQHLEAGGFIAAWRTWGAAAVMPAMIGGMWIGFALTLTETGASVLLVPPGTTTLSVRLMTLMHYAPTAQVSAVCLMLIAPPLAAGVFALLAQKWWWK